MHAPTVCRRGLLHSGCSSSRAYQPHPALLACADDAQGESSPSRTIRCAAVQCTYASISLVLRVAVACPAHTPCVPPQLCCAASGLRAIRPYAIRRVTCCGAYASIRESSLYTLPGRRTGVDQTTCGRPMTRKQSSETESSRGVVLENTVGLGSELHRGRVCGAKAFSRRSRTGCGPGA